MPRLINAVKLHANCSSGKLVSERTQNELAHIRRVPRESREFRRHFYQAIDLYVDIRCPAESTVPRGHANLVQISVGINDLKPKSNFPGILSRPHVVALYC